jgi:hypothetical protein
MSEKVIQSFEIIETDEGFRIEMKGDKEMLRQMLFQQGRPFFGGMPFGRGRGFGGHNPFGHHGRHEHHHHGHPHEGDETFEMEVEPLPEHLRDHLRDQLFFRRRFGGRLRDWKFKRGGYDMGPWWDESPSPDEQAPV